MSRDEFKLLKYNPIKIDPGKLAEAVMWHRGITCDHLNSISMAAHLRYSRELFFYMLYVHSSLTVTDMVKRYRVNGVAISGYIKSGASRVAKKDNYFITFRDHILSLFKNNDND